VRFYHAGLEREERADVERWFFASRGGLLTATSAYGMGVDKADIRSVIHVDVPPSPEAYLQESGRSGRDGSSSRAILLYSPEDDRFGEALEDPLARRRYAQMLAYARGRERCRRAVLLGYLGATPEHCDSCDICNGSAPSRPEGEAEILAALAWQKRRFTRDQAAHFLAGAGSYSARRLRLERYAASGALRGWEPDDVEAALGELALAGKVKRIAWGPWKGRLTVPRARGVRLARGSGDGGEATPSGTRTP
jgi:ATP-dependent DNA helicase RecQ